MKEQADANGVVFFYTRLEPGENKVRLEVTNTMGNSVTWETTVFFEQE